MNKGFVILSACLFLAFSSLKLFTGVLTLSTEPSTTLFLKPSPSFQTIYADTKISTDSVIIRDENGFIGDGLYFFTVDHGWYIVGLICLALVVIRTVFRGDTVT